MSLRLGRWLATLPGLSDFPLKVAFARWELLEGQPDELAFAFEELCQRVDAAEEASRAALLAFVPVLVDPENLAPIQGVRLAAREACLPAVSRLLRCSSRQGHRLDSPEPVDKEERALTLGERRALARKPSRAQLAKLLSDPHPMVAQILLANPRLTESDVVAMAARRPAIAKVMVEIAKSWCRRPRVRMALVLNPTAPPAVSIPLLGLLARPELREVSRAADLLPVVRVTASEQWELRPPLRALAPPEQLN